MCGKEIRESRRDSKRERKENVDHIICFHNLSPHFI